MKIGFVIRQNSIGLERFQHYKKNIAIWLTYWGVVRNMCVLIGSDIGLVPVQDAELLSKQITIRYQEYHIRTIHACTLQTTDNLMLSHSKLMGDNIKLINIKVDFTCEEQWC